jgi:hypothetical protein
MIFIHVDKAMVKLYHYTNLEGFNGITKDGLIRAKWPHSGTAHMPFGVYLTQLSPTTDSQTLISNNYNYGRNETNNIEFIQKTEYCFVIESEMIPQVYQRQTQCNRNEWVCPCDIYLADCKWYGLRYNFSQLMPQAQCQIQPKESAPQQVRQIDCRPVYQPPVYRLVYQPPVYWPVRQPACHSTANIYIV